MTEIWRDRSVMHWMFFLAGGIYASEEFSNGVKFLWFGLNVIAASLLSFCSLGHVFTVKVLSNMDAAFIFAIAAGIIGAQIAFPIITLWHRRDILKLFNFFANQSKRVKFEVSIRAFLITSINVFKETMFHTALIFLTLAFGLLVPALDLAVNHDGVGAFRSMNHHLMGMPYMDRISSLGVYCPVFCFEFLLIGSLVSQADIQVLLFVITITCKLNNIVVDYCKELQNLSTLLKDHTVAYGNSSDGLSRFGVELLSLVKRYRNISK